MRRGHARNWHLTAIVAGVLLAGAAGVASAQGADGNWWEALPGFGRPDNQPRRTSDEDPRRRADVVDDLRTDATPLRSDVMIEALEGAIQRYQAIVDHGGWPMLPGSRMIRPEDDDERMPLLRQRLMVSGELSRRSSGGGYGFGYGDDLEPAVRRYQFNNGLRVTGRVDKPTLQALNVPAQARLAQLRVNLQRLQGPDRPADRGSLRPGQCPSLPARGRGALPGGAAASRHRRQARAPDAGRARHHQGDQLLPLLAGARERRPSRPDPAARQGARLPRQGADPRLHRLLQRAGGRSHQHRLAPGGCQPSSGSARTRGRRTRSACCVSTCPTSTASTCTTRR